MHFHFANRFSRHSPGVTSWGSSGSSTGFGNAEVTTRSAGERGVFEPFKGGLPRTDEPNGIWPLNATASDSVPEVSASSASHGWKRRIVYVLNAALAVAVLAALGKTARDFFGEFQALAARGVSFQLHWGWCLAAGVCYSVSLLPAAWFWGRVLRATGQTASPGTVLRAYLVGQIGKYVPGKACVVILRTVLVSGRSVQPAMAAASVFIETLTMMSVGAALATLYFVLTARSDPRLLWGASGLAIIVTVPTLPPFFKPVLRLIANRGKRLDAIEAVNKVGFAQLWEGWVAMALLWAGFGLSLGLALRGIELAGYTFSVSGGTLARAFPVLVASVALATVGGFLVVFLPGGLGARELILATVLTPYLASCCMTTTTASPELVAVLAAVLLRAIWLITEVVLAGFFWAIPLLVRLLRGMGVAPSGEGS